MNKNVIAEDVTIIETPSTFDIINKGCESLDAKIEKLDKESFALNDQYKLLESRSKTESGFFNNISIQWKMMKIYSKLTEISDLVKPLNEERFIKTFGVESKYCDTILHDTQSHRTFGNE